MGRFTGLVGIAAILAIAYLASSHRRQIKLRIVAALRAKGCSADFNYRFQALGKQLKAANQRGAKKVVIVQPGGQTVAVKDLATGQQSEMPLAEFVASAP